MSASDEENPYEMQRLANIARNKALLESLGLDVVRIPDAQPKPSKSHKKKKTKAPHLKKLKARPPTTADGGNGSGEETVVEGDERLVSTRKRPNFRSEDSQDTLGARRSSRNIRRVSYANDGVHIVAHRRSHVKQENDDDYDSESDADDSEASFDEDDEDEKSKGSNRKRKRSGGKNSGVRKVAKLGNRIHDPKQYGSIPGVPVGAWFETRALCSEASVHAPWVAGIHGDPECGAYSVALSGGYPDDIDVGEAFTFTGAGGRDLRGTKDNPKNLRTAPQSCDQSFDKTLNKTLKASAETKNPVRVIRGFKLPSVYAPKSGYRYDGLYRVEKAWMDMGSEGFMVCKYALKRLPGQPPLPEKDADDEDEGEEDGEGSKSESDAGN